MKSVFGMKRLVFSKNALLGVKAVIFDVFGTLCFIGHKTAPYRPVFKHWAKENGGAKAAFRACMTENLTLSDLARQTGVPKADISRMETALAEEIASIQLFPEIPETLSLLQSQGIRLALISNLAQPYAEPVRRLLPVPFEVEAWSFDVGFMKPEDEIYQYALHAIKQSPSEILMVGDSLENDYNAPRRLGMRSCHLRRT